MKGAVQNLSYILLGEDRSASKAMQTAESTAQKVTGTIGTAFSKLGGVIGGELGGMLQQAGSSIEGLSAKGKSLSATLEVGGAITTGAGLALMELGSGAKQATDQLNQAIKNAGESSARYATQIDAVVSKQQNFDHSAEDTKTALRTLVSATGSTSTALKYMGVVSDLAAAKHMSLEAASSQVAKVLGGRGGRALAEYGIVMQKAVDPTKAIAAAQTGLTKAQDILTVSQQKLTQLQDIDHTKKKLTLADHFALQAAVDKVTLAQGGLTAAEKKLATAQESGITKTQAGKAAVEQLAQKLNGQASASVDNFGSQFDILKTKVTDFVKEAAGPVGQTMTVLGPIFTVAGLAVDIYKTRQEAAALATLASRDAAVADSVALDTELTPAVVGASTKMGGMSKIGSVLSSPAGIAAIGVAAVYAASEIGTLTDAAYNNTIQFGKASDAAKAYDKQLSLDQAGPKGLFGNAKTDRGQALQLTTGANQGFGQFFTGVGLGGLNQQFQGATSSIQKIDASMAHLVQSGNAQTANAEFQKWADAAKAQGLSIDTVIGKFPAYESALNSVANSEILAAQGANQAAGSLASLAQSAGLKSAGYVSPAAGKKHAAGGSFVANSPTMLTPLDQVGESGPERIDITPMNAGRPSSGGGSVNVYLTVAPQMMFGGTVQQQATALHGALVNLYKSGGAKTELKHALGLV